MTCLRPDKGNPLDICNATVGQVAAAYPGAATALRVAVVFSLLTAAGVLAAVLLVAWRRRGRRGQVAVVREPVRFRTGVVPGRRHEPDAGEAGRPVATQCSDITVVLRGPRSGEDDRRAGEPPWPRP